MAIVKAFLKDFGLQSKQFVQDLFVHYRPKINETTIILIPKIPNPKNLAFFGSISLCKL